MANDQILKGPSENWKSGRWICSRAPSRRSYQSEKCYAQFETFDTWMNFYLIWRKSGLSIKSYNRLRKYNSILPLFTIVYLWVKEYTAGYLASITGLPWSDYPCLLHRAMGLWVASSIQVHLMTKNFSELKSLSWLSSATGIETNAFLKSLFQKEDCCKFHSLTFQSEMLWKV